MTLQIALSPQAALKLSEQAAAAGKDVVSYVREAVERMAEHGNDNGETRAAVSAQDWSAEWHAWAAGHRRLEGPADDSRDSIYAGRGE